MCLGQNARKQNWGQASLCIQLIWAPWSAPATDLTVVFGQGISVWDVCNSCQKWFSSLNICMRNLLQFLVLPKWFFRKLKSWDFVLMLIGSWVMVCGHCSAKMCSHEPRVSINCKGGRKSSSEQLEQDESRGLQKPHGQKTQRAFSYKTGSSLPSVSVLLTIAEPWIYP